MTSSLSQTRARAGGGRPLVSVLIPCYNAEPFVCEAVESALDQTCGGVEVIVADDGSSDGSVGAIRRRFGSAVRVESLPNRGACAARNRAFELSRGRFIQFLDADDLLTPDKLEKQLPPLLSGEADLVFSKGMLFGDGRPARPKKRPVRRPEGEDPFVYCLSQGLSTVGPLHRRECIEKVGGFREGVRRAQELDLHLRLAATNVRILLLEECLYSVREHAGPRITRSSQPPDQMLKLLLELADLLEAPPYELTAPRRDALAGALIQHSLNAYRHGAEGSAAAGLRRARQLSPRADYDERRWYKAGARLVGPLSMEWVLKQARRRRDALRGGWPRAGGGR
ncbi:MAG TPA: glycosyltransferase family 2 protein [Pyrinomonadaceae bacterium]|nr:glycosyltransferase family 2 protein [Pyrinomonadaceae bacterium]